MKLCYWGQLGLALLPRLASFHWLRHLPSLYSSNDKQASKGYKSTLAILERIENGLIHDEAVFLKFVAVKL